MSEALNTSLDKSQRDLLLDGLKYVRSSVLLEFRESSEDDSARREKRLQEIEDLVHQLNGTRPANVPAGV